MAHLILATFTTDSNNSACVSPHVTVLLESGRVHRVIARAFLSRSDFLYSRIVGVENCKKLADFKKGNHFHPCCYESQTLDLSEEKESIFKLFFAWSMMEQPTLAQKLTIEQVLELALFARKYAIPALKDQVADRLQWGFATRVWTLTPDLLQWIWTIAEEDGSRWIGALVVRLLGDIGGDGNESDWQHVLRKNPTLYPYHSDACLYQLTVLQKEYEDGCLFHAHPRGKQSGAIDIPIDIEAGICPYMAVTLFPKIYMGRPNGWYIEQDSCEGLPMGMPCNSFCS